MLIFFFGGGGGGRRCIVIHVQNEYCLQNSYPSKIQTSLHSIQHTARTKRTVNDRPYSKENKDSSTVKNDENKSN